MKRSSFLKSLGALIGVSALSPTLLGGEVDNNISPPIKPEVKVINTNRLTIPIPDGFVKMPLPCCIVDVPNQGEETIMALSQKLETCFKHPEITESNGLWRVKDSALSDTKIESIKNELISKGFTHIYSLILLPMMYNPETFIPEIGIMVRGYKMDDYYPISGTKSLAFYIEAESTTEKMVVNMNLKSTPIDEKYEHLLKDKKWKNGNALPTKEELMKFFEENNIPWLEKI